MNMVCETNLLEALDLVALLRRPEGGFSLTTQLPAWFVRLCPGLQPGDLPDPPEEHFPFLANFMVDAEAFWEAGQNGRIRSGIWIQTAPDGEEMALEASALLTDQARFLVLESCQYAHSEKQSLIQTGRLLELDLYQHQQRETFDRALREELEARIKDRTASLLDTISRLKSEITERRKAQTSLSESEHRFQILFDNLFDAQFLMDANGQIRDVNQAACRLMAATKDDLRRCAITSLFEGRKATQIRDAVIEAARNGVVYIDESILLGEGQSPIPVEGGGVGLDMDGCRHVLFSLRDISYRKQLQAQLQQAQKMEAIGSLSSGIAHDFNNILSAIIGYTEMACMDLDADSLPYRNLRQVLAASERAKELVQQILTFSRQAESVSKPVKIIAIVTEALKLIRATMPASIEIHQHLDSQSYVCCDPTQIHQICINLFSNAAHAMAQEGGDLDVSLNDIDLDSDFLATQPGLSAGPHVRLVVSDTGKGIAEPNLTKIFNPFFTTKSVGQGTGMGLSVVHGIVNAAGGAITVNSQSGQGCVFTVYLPIMEAGADELPAHQPLMQGGRERILFVDDEKFQADLAAQALGRLGYQVTAKTSSVEALAVFEANPEAVDLVITDLTMPHLAGTALAKKIHALRVDMPIVLISGFSSSINEKRAREEGFVAYLKKPLVIGELANAVRWVLDGCEDSPQACGLGQNCR